MTTCIKGSMEYSLVKKIFLMREYFIEEQF